MNQFIATDKKYWEKKTIEEIRDLSEKTFIASVERSKKEKLHIDPKFCDASTVKFVKTYGGVYPEYEYGNWNAWVHSVLELRNPTCAKWEAVPLTDLLEVDQRVIGRKAVFMKALGIYLNRPSCNHIKYSNTEPINAILKITDVYKCTTDV